MSEERKVENTTKCYIPKRYIVTALSFFGLFNAYCMRVNVSVAIVAMVNSTKTTVINDTHYPTECPDLFTHEDHIKESLKGERYNWDPATQGYILSAFFYGYFIVMLPGGYLAEKFGATRLFGFCIISTSLLTLLTPVVVRWGLVPLLVLRVLEGLGEGATYPCVVAIISRWSPKLERSRIASIVFTGGPLGSVFSFIVSGQLSSSYFLGGWPSVFYVFGALGCIWYIFWFILIYETPDYHPTISKEELSKFDDNSYSSNLKHEVPWKSIATSVPFYALIVTNFGHMFGFNIMITEIPTYLNTVLHFNIKSSGFLSSLPNIAEAVGGWISPFIADKLRASGKIGVTPIRKIFNSIGGFAPTICMILVTFCGCQSSIIIVLLSVGLFFNGFKYSGYTAAVVDMTPDFAGTLYGIANGLANITGIIAPTIVGHIISSGATIANWSKVFYITAGVYFFTTVVFALFASAELQPWGKCQPDIEDKEKK